jgi:hypothetical protein
MIQLCQYNGIFGDRGLNFSYLFAEILEERFWELVVSTEPIAL